MNRCPYCQSVLPVGTRRCPHCQTDLAEMNAGQGRVQSTQLESVPDLRQGGQFSGQFQRTPTAKEPQPGGQQGGSPDTTPWRPLLRPPMAVLCTLDDGSRETGDWLRIRSQRIVIGRSEGDVIIPNDDGMSGKHAEISRRDESGWWRWYLKDLGSTNGTFVRVAKVLLRHGQEFLIGSRRYRFNAASQAASLLSSAAAAGADSAQKGTRGWQSVSPAHLADLLPSIVELTGQGEGQRFSLDKAENWIGSDLSHCSIVPADDPFVSPRHAKFSKDERGRWRVENSASTNGTWVRIEEIALDKDAEFQLGEQRFRLMFP